MRRRGLHGGELFALILLFCVALDVAASLLIKPDLLRVSWLWANELVSGLSIAAGLVALAVGSVLGYVSHEAFNEAVSPAGEVKYILKTGPYRLVRHPFYLALALVALSFFLFLRSYALLAGLVAVALVLLADARQEEGVLVDRFGEAYLSYQRDTGMLLPRLFGGRTGRPPS